MNNTVDITALLGTGYVQTALQNGQNAIFKNGRLVCVILDVNKPGKVFVDLTSAFNASTGEGGKTLTIMFMNNASPFDLNNKTVKIVGQYPSGIPFSATGAVLQASKNTVNFNFPLGLFQEAGIYQFQFEITDESGNTATSHWCFFQVSQNATSLAFDYNNGVNPFDSDFEVWKNKCQSQVTNLQTEMNNLSTQITQTQSLLNNDITNAQSVFNSQWATQIDTNNTFGATQTFNNLTATGNINLPASTNITDSDGSIFNITQALHVEDRGVNGGSLCYLNNTATANQGLTTWCWCARYVENAVVQGGWSSWFFHFCFELSTLDVGKPFASFNTNFFQGANDSPVTVPVQNGSFGFHIDATSDTLVLDWISSNLSGNVHVGNNIWA